LFSCGKGRFLLLLSLRKGVRFCVFPSLQKAALLIIRHGNTPPRGHGESSRGEEGSYVTVTPYVFIQKLIWRR